MEKTAHKLDLM